MELTSKKFKIEISKKINNRIAELADSNVSVSVKFFDEVVLLGFTGKNLREAFRLFPYMPCLKDSKEFDLLGQISKDYYEKIRDKF